ncbi:MAG TPA: helix-turn-helix domain-containing GNAT family N-acetyltransferase [Burkholderiales bacterium]|nr:helix-turn-helix domain-containing GNAT family N-acetyltransferase [Burkholderiales bacterium]
MRQNGFAQRIDTVRRFNRFYTRRIGVLHDGLLGSPYSLAEVRVLYEIAHRNGPTAAELGRELGLDAGYLSRLVRRLERSGLVARTPSATDGRRSHLALTAKGRRTFATLNSRSNDEVAALLEDLPDGAQGRLVSALETVEAVLSADSQARVPYLLRTHEPGDIGWVIGRHGALYAQEYGWDETFEALVAEIAARFVRRFDPKRERCWIAERDGRNVGSVFLVRKSAAVAQLRLLIVTPEARGLGIGKRLVSECERFARQAGYRKIVLWTNRGLDAARRIYEEAGYRLAREEPHHSFGRDLVGQYWELRL